MTSSTEVCVVEAVSGFSPRSSSQKVSSGTFTRGLCHCGEVDWGIKAGQRLLGKSGLFHTSGHRHGQYWQVGVPPIYSLQPLGSSFFLWVKIQIHQSESPTPMVLTSQLCSCVEIEHQEWTQYIKKKTPQFFLSAEVIDSRSPSLRWKTLESLWPKSPGENPSVVRSLLLLKATVVEYCSGLMFLHV